MRRRSTTYRGRRGAAAASVGAVEGVGAAAESRPSAVVDWRERVPPAGHWVSVDPASAKPCAVALWRRQSGRAVFAGLREAAPEPRALREAFAVDGVPPALVVVEQGFVGRNKAVSLELERVRGYCEAVGAVDGAAFVGLQPTAWRGLLEQSGLGTLARTGLAGSASVTANIAKAEALRVVPLLVLGRWGRFRFPPEVGLASEDGQEAALVGLAHCIDRGWL